MIFTAYPFAQHSLDMLPNQSTLLRMTSMTQKNRIGESISAIERILTAIEVAEEVAADGTCVQYVRNTAAVAFKPLQQSQP